MLRIPLPACLALGCLLLATGCQSGPRTGTIKLTDVARKYYETGKYREASLVFRRVLQHEPRNGPAYYWVGMCSLKKLRPDHGAARAAFVRAFQLQLSGAAQRDEYDAYGPLSELVLYYVRNDSLQSKKARAELEELTDVEEKFRPGSRHAPRIRGSLLLLDGKPSEAVGPFRTALQRAPGDPAAIELLFRALYRSGSRQEAENLIFTALQRDDRAGSLYRTYLDMLAANRRWADTERILDLYISKLPGDIGARLAKAEYFLKRARLEQANRALDDILAARSSFPGAHRMVGQFYVRFLDVDRGIAVYREGMGLDPRRHEDYLERIAEALVMKGDATGARTTADELLKISPSSSQGLALRGLLRLEREPELGMADLAEAVKVSPENGAFRYALGRVQAGKGDMEAAEINLSDAVRMLPTSSQPRFQLAQVYAAQGKYSNVLVLADQILAINPSNLAAAILRATAHVETSWQSGVATTAKEELDRLAAVAPDHPDLWFLRGRLAERQGVLDKAEAAYRKLAGLSPQDSRARHGLLAIFLSTRRLDDAVKLIEEESVRDPNRVELQFYRAQLSVQRGKLAEALQFYRSIASAHPGKAEAWAGIGRVYYVMNDYRQAEPPLRKAIDLDPGNLTGNLHLGTILLMTGRIPEAEVLLEKAVNLSPNDVTALNNLAFLIAENGGDLNRAIGYAQRAVGLAPKDPVIRDTLGRIYYRKQLYASAAEVFRSNVKEQPAVVEWRCRLAQALLGEGNAAAAKQELYASLGHKPSAEEATKIESLLRVAAAITR